MVAILYWTGRWRRKQLWRNLPAHFQLLLMLWLGSQAIVNLMVVAQQQQQSSSINGTDNKNVSDIDDGSGSWEYYYEDEDDPSSNSSSSTNSTSRTGQYPNSTSHGDEYYYYFEEEVVVKPKNGSGQGKMIKTTTLKIDKSRKGAGAYNRDDSMKSASMPYLGIGANVFGGGHSDSFAIPSIEPFKELATPLEVEGPVYTDNNYDYGQQQYHYSGPDTAVGKPLGPGEFPTSPFKEQAEPALLRPPPLTPTQPPAESGLELDVVKHVEYIDGVADAGVGEIGEDVKSTIYDDDDKVNNLLSGFQLPNLRTKFKVEAYGSIAPEKNPILKAKQFIYHLWEVITTLTTSELVLWAEKGFNLVAELSIPQEHYLRVISFAGIYLFIAMLTYRADQVVDLVCTLDAKDKPFKRWKFHAARRFVPARSVDPHLQKRFLKLFRGIKEKKRHDDEEDEIINDISSSSSQSSQSSEEDIADELDHISELCPEDAFFFSLNPRHVEAYTLLQQILVAQDSPKKFLKLAKRLLRKEKVHPKVWYFAIMGAFLERQDLTGFSIVHPLDAIPDWYIPADLISKHMKRHRDRRIRVKRTASSNVTSSNAVATIHFSQEDEASMEGLPLKLPVKSGIGNYTVTIVTSKKKPVVPQKDFSSSASVPSSEESSNSNSVEPTEQNEETALKINNKVEKMKPTLTLTPKIKPYRVVKKQQQEQQQQKVKKVDKVKGHTGVIAVKVVKEKPSKGNVTLNETLLDSRHRKGKKKKCIKVNWKVGLDNGQENDLFYFREDMMLNQHHWYWHMTHPFNSTQHGDRRAELFFYMHRAIVARYNAERLSNGMKRVTALNFRNHGIIQAGYNSHLASGGVYWAPRWPNTPLSDIFHDHDPDFAQNITLSYYNALCRRIVRAIVLGKLFPESGPPLRINSLRGIEPLANTIEAADISVNPMYYDSRGIHALGHIMVGLAADPDFRFKSVTGVMSDAAVSMRDPAFYAYHSFMDNIFELHKERLPPYTVVGGDFPLLWKGVKVVKIELRSQGGAPKNELRTFWTHHNFELSPGVDGSIKKGKKKKHKAEVCAQHLDHEPFYFKIVIDRQHCVKTKSGLGTVRIFMAPRYDEKGRRIPVKVQRRLMFPLDVFTVKLKVGRNTITRYSEDSSLTQPWTKSFRDLARGPDPSGASDFCGCGWPQHLYIPKGHVAGMAFDLFVMLTNYDEDYVPNDPKILEVPETCNSPYIFCGLPRRRYPDRRPMGYPFDRPLFKSLNCPPGWTFSSVVCKSVNLVINKPLDTLEEYVSKAPNMAMLKFHIRHMDTFLPEPSRHR